MQLTLAIAGFHLAISYIAKVAVTTIITIVAENRAFFVAGLRSFGKPFLDGSFGKPFIDGSFN
jgi:hypothetical protein